MKRTVLMLLTALLVIATAFMLLPTAQPLEYVVELKVPQQALQRILFQPGNASPNANSAGAVALRPAPQGRLPIIVHTGAHTYHEQIKIAGAGPGITRLSWNTVLYSGRNPADRFSTWREGRRLKATMAAYLDGFRRFE